MTDDMAGELALRVIARQNRESPNSNFQIKGFDQQIYGSLVQALICTLRDEGLLVGCERQRRIEETT